LSPIRLSCLSTIIRLAAVRIRAPINIGLATKVPTLTVIKHKIHIPVAAITTMTNPMPPLEVAMTDALDALPATQRHPNTGSTAPIGTPTGCRPKALGVPQAWELTDNPAVLPTVALARR
jgi:hypothetical protein